MSVYTTGMMPTTPPNPLFPDTSLSPALCSPSMCVHVHILWVCTAREPHVKVQREQGVLRETEKGEENELGGRWYEEWQRDTPSKNRGGGREQMSDVVGGSERKTVCVMSSHFLLHIHVIFTTEASRRQNWKGVFSSSNATLESVKWQIQQLNTSHVF